MLKVVYEVENTYRIPTETYLNGGIRAMPQGKAKRPTLLAEATPVGVLYTTDEVAQLLKVAPRTVQDWIRKGQLPAVKYGRIYRVRAEDLQRFGRETGRKE
jgi:excisionase family DNA binding protein